MAAATDTDPPEVVGFGGVAPPVPLPPCAAEVELAWPVSRVTVASGDAPAGAWSLSGAPAADADAEADVTTAPTAVKVTSPVAANERAVVALTASFAMVRARAIPTAAVEAPLTADPAVELAVAVWVAVAVTAPLSDRRVAPVPIEAVVVTSASVTATAGARPIFALEAPIRASVPAPSVAVAVRSRVVA